MNQIDSVNSNLKYSDSLLILWEKLAELTRMSNLNTKFYFETNPSIGDFEIAITVSQTIRGLYHNQCINIEIAIKRVTYIPIVIIL